MQRVRTGILAIVICVGIGCQRRALTADERGGAGGNGTALPSGAGGIGGAAPDAAGLGGAGETGGAGPIDPGTGGAGGSPRGTGGSAGEGDAGRGGGSGVGGAGGRSTSVGPDCHPTLAVGDPCAAGEPPCWAGICSACGFELWMWRPMQVFCACYPGPNADAPVGVWTCRDMLGGGPVIVDCHLGDEPLDCNTAQALFSDAACTEHPSCTD